MSARDDDAGDAKSADAPGGAAGSGAAGGGTAGSGGGGGAGGSNASCGMLGRTCNGNDDCGDGLQCLAVGDGICEPSGREINGVFQCTGSDCPAATPLCLLVSGASGGVCVTQTEQRCMCDVAAATTRFRNCPGVPTGGPCMPERVGELEGFENNLTELDAASVGSGSEPISALRRELVVEQNGASGYAVGRAYITRRTSASKRGPFIVEVTNATAETRCVTSVSFTLWRQDGSLLRGTIQTSAQGSMGVDGEGAYHSTCLYAGETAFMSYGLTWEFENSDLFLESARATVSLGTVYLPGGSPAARFIASDLALSAEGALRVKVTNVGLGAGRILQDNAGSYVLLDAPGQPVAAGGLTLIEGAPRLLAPGESATVEEYRVNFFRFSGSTAKIRVRLDFYDPNENCRAH